MAWSYRKRIKIAPGISINLSKSGISTSIGPRGAKVTIGPKGTYLSAGIPGTGIYSRQKISSANSSSKPSYASGLYSSSSYAGSRSSYDEDFGVNMKMDNTGSLSFSFTDSLGRPITDETVKQRLIRKTKASPQYKEHLAKLTRMTHDEVNEETQKFTELYKKSPELKRESDISAVLEHVVQKHYIPLPFTEAEPDKDDVQKKVEEEAKEKIVHLFWWKNKADRQKYVEENLPTAYADEIKAWQQRKNDFIAEQERIRKDKDREYLVDYLDEKKPLDLFLTSNPDFIIDGLKEEDVKLNDEIPGGFGLDFSLDLEYQTLYVDLDLPEVEDIPRRKAEYLPSGNVSFKQKTQKEVQFDYIKCICGLAFLVAGRFFNVNCNIKYIQISGFTQRVNRATGEEGDDYVYTVFFDKESFSRLIIENIDPLLAMREFPCRIKVSATGILSSIVPFPVPEEEGFVRGERYRNEPKETADYYSAPKEESVPETVAPVTPAPTPFMSGSNPYKSRPGGPLPIELLEPTVELNNRGMQQEKDGLIDDAIATYEECIAIGYPAHHAYKRLMVLYSKKGDKENELRVAKLAVDKFPDEIEYQKRLIRLTGNKADAVYPTERVVFEGREVLGEVFEAVIRHRIPEFDFYQSPTGDRVQNDFLAFKKDLEPVYRLQGHFRSLLEAADRFEAEGKFDKACYTYEQLLFEKYYMPAPYDRLIKIYSKAHLKEAEKEVLKASIEHFKELRESRLQYVEHLADKYGAIEFLSQRVDEGKKITYYSGVFELYNPFPIIDEWEKRLAKLES